MNGVIRQKMIKLECPSKSIEQWYERAINLDRHQRKNKRKKERLRERRETGTQIPRVNIPENTGKAQWQQLQQPQV